MLLIQPARTGVLRRIGSSKRARCCAFFLAAGIGIGAWASSLPLVTTRLAINKGELGFLLLGFALGAIVLMVTIGQFIDRLQSDKLSLAGCVVFGACILSIPLAPSVLAAALLILAAGAGFGTLDVSMNTEASHLERTSKRHLMSSFHGVFSVGALLGALLVGQLVSIGGGLNLCLGIAGSIVVLVAFGSRLIARKRPLEQGIGRTQSSAIKAIKLGPEQLVLVIMFGAIAFLSMLAEGGVMDWTAIFLVTEHGASESVGAYAFATFSATMALGRFAGDLATRRIGHVNVIRIGGVVCAVSVLVVVVSSSISVTLFALGFCGIGVANLVPAVFAAAGHLGGDSAGRAMSIATTMGYSGLLLGPALLGFVAEHSSLTTSFGVITAGFVLVAVVGFAVGKRMALHGLKLRHEP
ncbi:MFS transporter [Rhizobium sp. R634]|uniref:MFS transporter n=1 Tax=Rhizobium sp. R634 TaxID=1764274 RepID=UPI000B534E04|nr:MFS transporter [Rhizobium sp. R634]OWV82395.1 MFS transporter [Rhizobium sp. R634]